MNRFEFIKSLAVIPFTLDKSMPQTSFVGESDMNNNEESFWNKIHNQFHTGKEYLDFRCHAASSVPKSVMNHYQYQPDDEKIEKFESLGTITPVFKSAALSLEFWNKLGMTMKTNRVNHLKEYWATILKEIKNVELLTNIERLHSCGIAYFKIKNRSSKEIGEILNKKYQISTQVIENYKNSYVDYKNVNAIGIATPVFITKGQLDLFIKAIREISA